jgi:hypothetical protein
MVLSSPISTGVSRLPVGVRQNKVTEKQIGHLLLLAIYSCYLHMAKTTPSTLAEQRASGPPMTFPAWLMISNLGALQNYWRK